LRGTRCYVELLAAQTGPLNWLCPIGAFGLTLQNGQLLSQSEVLQSELALRLQARAGGREQGVQQVNHRGR
jgi:hypothetical protein